MVDRNLTYNLIGKDVSASSAMNSLAGTSEKMSARVGTAFGTMGGYIGGEFGEILNNASTGFNNLAEAGEGMGTKLAVAGGGILALGLAFGTLGSGEQAARQQLDQAITATGASVSDYSDEIEKAISKGEDFGHSGTDTQNALAKLTETTGDVGTALSNMTLVENIAAAKHESLSAAANQLSLAMGGNSKVFKQFGIDLGTTKPTADQLNGALSLLASKLQGQAAAATDTFSGKIDSLKTHLGDMAATVGEKVTPYLGAAGSVALVLGTTMDFVAAHTKDAAEATDILSASTDTATASETGQKITAITLAAQMDALRMAEINAALATDAIGVSADGAAASELGLASAEDVASASALGILGPIGLVVGALAAAAVGGDMLASKIGGELDPAWQKDADTLKNVKTALAGFESEIQNAGGVMDTASQKTLLTALQAAGLGDAYMKTKLNLADFANMIQGSDAAFNLQMGTFQKTNALSLEQAATLEHLKAQFDAGTISGKQLAQAEAELSPPAKAATAATNTLITSLDAETQALNDASDNMLSAQQSADSFKDSQASLATTLKTNGKSLDDNTVKGRANVEAVDAAIAAAKAHADAVFKQTDNVQLATAALQGDEGQLQATTKAAGLNQAEIANMILEYGGIPSDIPTKVDLDIANAIQNLNTLEAAIDAENASHHFVAVMGGGYDPNSHAASGGIIGDASGGIGMAGGGIKSLFGTQVQEFGSEGLDMTTGRVYPHGQWQQMKSNAGGSGGPVYNITVNIPTITQPTVQTGQMLIAAINQALNAGGKLGRN